MVCELILVLSFILTRGNYIYLKKVVTPKECFAFDFSLSGFFNFYNFF